MGHLTCLTSIATWEGYSEKLGATATRRTGSAVRRFVLIPSLRCFPLSVCSRTVTFVRCIEEELSLPLSVIYARVGMAILHTRAGEQHTLSRTRDLRTFASIRLPSSSGDWATTFIPPGYRSDMLTQVQVLAQARKRNRSAASP